MATAEEVKGIFPAMVARFLPEKAEGINATILFDLSGENGGYFWIKATGQTNAMQAFMTGKLKILGDMGLAMKMQTMFAQ